MKDQNLQNKTDINPIAASPKPEKVPDNKHVRTAGEKIFDEITYRGLDWLLNTTVAVGFAYWTERTHAGRKYFTEPVTHFFKRILKPLVKNPQKLDESAKWGSLFTSIMAGGFTIIPPIMVMEANKKPIVKKLDELYYGKERVQNDPVFEQSYKEIEKEPPQDLTTGMIARFVSLAPILAMMMAIPQTLTKWVYQPIAKRSQWLTDTLHIKPKKLINTVQPAKDGTPINDWEYIHQTFGADVSVTLLYSFLHEYTYKYFSDRMNRESGQESNLRTERDMEQATEPGNVSHEPSNSKMQPAPSSGAKPTGVIAAEGLSYGSRTQAGPSDLGTSMGAL